MLLNESGVHVICAKPMKAITFVRPVSSATTRRIRSEALVSSGVRLQRHLRHDLHHLQT